jgi:protein TonB
MTPKLSIGGVVPLPSPGHGRVSDRAAVSARADLSNVIPFVARAAEMRSAPDVVLPAELVRLPQPHAGDQARFAAFIALSLMIHCGLAVFLWHEPPRASIGVEVISVELVLGATTPAGVATTPGENEVTSASAPETPSPEPQETEKATTQPQEVETAKQETAPEEKAEPKVQEPPQMELAAAAEAPAEPKPSVAMVETAEPEIATAAPREPPPDRPEFSLLPQPQEKPVEKKLDPKPEAKKQSAPPKPVKDAAPAKERRRVAAPTREKPSRDAKASTPSTQANGIGIGRSSDDTNYRGLVSSHLARYKQYPADAKSRGSGGTASVSFTIGGSGGVTSVRLAHGSGIASIDTEVQAMVRRASPFPPPPGGRPQSFTVPVSFRLN